MVPVIVSIPANRRAACLGLSNCVRRIALDQHQVRWVHLLPLEDDRLVVAGAAAAVAAGRLGHWRVAARRVEAAGQPQQSPPAIAHLHVLTNEISCHIRVQRRTSKAALHVVGLVL